MLWIEALHVIFMVTWFSGLFYLPRLYVYHAMSTDQISKDRFILMERKLYFGITMPGAIFTTIFGIWLLTYNFSYYIHASWMLAKLALVAILWIYHIYLGKLWVDFKKDRNKHSHVFYRWLNEFPVLILVGVVILVIVKP
jgi:protoporphyrinogen IX oxidase